MKWVYAAMACYGPIVGWLADQAFYNVHRPDAGLGSWVFLAWTGSFAVAAVQRFIEKGTEMRILVCGGRAYSNSESVDAVLGFLDAYGAITAVVHGGAAGADTLAGRYATKNGIPERVFHADWAKYGPRAGPIRNAEMLAKGNPDIVVAFPGGRGTADMVRRAHEKLVSVLDLRPFNQSARD